MTTSKEVKLSELFHCIKDYNKYSGEVIADMIAFNVPSGVRTVIQDVYLDDEWYEAIREALEDSDPIITLVMKDITL